MTRLRSTLFALGSLGPIAGLALLAPWLRVPVLAAIALGFGSTVATVLLASHAAIRARLGHDVRSTLRVAALGVLLSALALALGRGCVPGSPRDVLTGLLSNGAILLFANALGTLVGARVPHGGHLLPVALVSSAVDLWSVLAPEGPTRAITVAPDPAWLRVLAASAPIVPSRAMEPMLGMADGVFAALYLSAIRRHDLSLTRATIALAAGLLSAGVAVVLLARPLPALPFLGLFVLLLVPEARRVPAQDRKAALFSLVMLVVALVRLGWVARGRR
jgi:hypothetical protein